MRIELGLNYTFKDELAEYYTVFPNKCIWKPFKSLANILDRHFTWTPCILMIYWTYIDKLKCNTYTLQIGIDAITWHSKSSVNVLHIKYLFIYSLRFCQQTLFFWQKNFLLALSDQVLLQDYIWKWKNSAGIPSGLVPLFVFKDMQLVLADKIYCQYQRHFLFFEC